MVGTLATSGAMLQREDETAARDGLGLMAKEARSLGPGESCPSIYTQRLLPTPCSPKQRRSYAMKQV